MSIRLLGVRIDNLKKTEILAKIAGFLSDPKPHTIFTPNPEMLVDATRDSGFRRILNNSDLNVCDGKGIQLVAKEKIERIPGVDLMLEICRIAEKDSKSVYFLGSDNTDTLKNLVKNMKNLFPSLIISGDNPGPKITMKQFNHLTILKTDAAENDNLLNEINSKSPSILFVAFGHGKQEKWISQNIARLPSVRIAMGVGGAFDYLSGKIKRAPARLGRYGFEWLWRLGREPKRIGRIIKATIVFLFLVFFENKSA